MTSTDALAARLTKRFGLWGGCKMPCDTEEQWAEVAAFFREQLPTRAEIVEIIANIYGRTPDGSAYPSNYRMADALLARLAKGRKG